MPSAPPQNITARNASSTSIILQWPSLPQHLLRGILRGYRIYYKKANSLGALEEGSLNLSPSILKAEIKNLTKYALYHYCVQALTIGYGECVLSTFHTDEDGNLDVLNFSYFITRINNLESE